MLCTSNANVDTILVLNKITRSCPYHWDKNEVKLTSLRAINWQDLVINFIINESLWDSILLGVVRGYHVDRVLGKLLDRDTIILVMSLETLGEFLETELLKLFYYLDFCQIVVRSSLFDFQFLTIRYINKQKWRLRIHKMLLRVAHVAWLYHIAIEKRIWNIHKWLVHSVLSV